MPTNVDPIIPVTPVISPEQITEYIKMALQAQRVSFLNVGKLLAMVRDGKLYAQLGHADLDSYAKARLQLGHSTLFLYLRVRDWVAENHPEWFDPEPGTFIPDLYDIDAAAWVDKQLAKPELTPEIRTDLKTLKKKALSGKLTKSERTDFAARMRHTPEDGLRKFLKKLQALREEGTQVEGMPPEIVSGLDDLAELLQNALKVPLRLVESGETGHKTSAA